MQRLLSTVASVTMCSVLLAGCEQPPFPSARPAVALKWPGFQEKADAIQDWEVVAHQIALDMMQRGLLHDPSNVAAAPTAAEQQPYYINVAIPSSQFLHEVRQSLQADILQYGGAVARSSYGAVVINLDADVVYWPSAYSHHDGAPSTEVAWEASIASGNQIIFDVRYPMYVSELDVPRYAAPPVGPPPVQLHYTP